MQVDSQGSLETGSPATGVKVLMEAALTSDYQGSKSPLNAAVYLAIGFIEYQAHTCPISPLLQIQNLYHRAISASMSTVCLIQVVLFF